jgi:hypothetical protein
MKRVSRVVCLLFILILTLSSGSLTIKPISAQSIPKPSVPEFTVKLVAHPYDVSPSTSIDPYTGKTITTQQGYHVENKSIELTITNQDYPYTYNGSECWIAFNIRTKGHFGNQWTELFNFNRYFKYFLNDFPTQTITQYTIINIPADTYALDSQIDIQIQAFPKYVTEIMIYPHIQGSGYPEKGYGLTEGSGWSNIKTINFSDDSVSVSTSPTPNPTPTPSVPEFSWLTILPLLLSAPIVLAIIRKRLRGNAQGNKVF